MLIRYPKYYKDFSCLAGACPDTCCGGWEISADKKTRKKYRTYTATDEVRRPAGHALRDALGYTATDEVRRPAGHEIRDALGYTNQDRKLREKLKKAAKSGILCRPGMNCGFLNREGLCEICLKYGEKALCRTCRTYPRHMEDYGKLREIVLLISCPEAAGLVLEHGMDGYYTVRKNRTADMSGIDGSFLSELLEVREALWKIGADRRLPVDIRMIMALSLAHDVQRRLNQNRLYLKNNRRREIRTLLERYTGEQAAGQFTDRIRTKYTGLSEDGTEMPGEENGRFLLMSDFMEVLSELPPVGTGWPEMLEECREDLYHSKDSRTRYARERSRFLRQNRELELYWERLFGYFIYSFFLTALYDRDVYTKVKMAVFSCLAVEELDFAAWRKCPGVNAADGGWLDRQMEIVHIFARQIENSDENRRILEEKLKTSRFSLKQTAGILKADGLYFSRPHSNLSRPHSNPYESRSERGSQPIR